jgi:hypothetical protein
LLDDAPGPDVVALVAGVPVFVAEVAALLRSDATALVADELAAVITLMVRFLHLSYASK